VLGGFDTHERLVRELANKANVVIVFVNYTRSPEAKYPIPIEEAYAATKWVAENGKSINVDASRLAIAGDSVGGNMAAAVTLLAKERRGPKIAFQALFYPVTDANFDTQSYNTLQEGYWLTLCTQQRDSERANYFAIAGFNRPAQGIAAGTSYY
jgi:acetyl esterase